MLPTTTILLTTAASIGFFHTLVGVDHSLPLVVLARSQGWSLRRLLVVTALCGVAHVLSSVVIGAVGIAMGAAVGQLTVIETARGELAARLLIGFGLAYMIWGLYRSQRREPHTHLHHHHHRGAGRLSVIGLFVVFVLGPCEALIPMVMAPSVEHSWSVVVAVVTVFGAATLLTMLALVTIGYLGLRSAGRLAAGLERYMHAAAGFAIAASGLAIELLGI
ncbi:MAG: hypothetical protein KC731_00515 [Myxococcales bacterium]|nr:hypothetical protein [Myxococcales bacterium]